jgi:uridine kinase
VVEQFEKNVQPMHELFVEGQKRFADFVFASPGSAELRLLEKHISKLLQENAR